MINLFSVDDRFDKFSGFETKTSFICIVVTIVHMHSTNNVDMFENFKTPTKCPIFGFLFPTSLQVLKLLFIVSIGTLDFFIRNS